ncbi:rhodanese-like domain-containing protein [Fodinibius sp. SL11]|uniref:rhodanese-like domain-containing protein n=1 Tax=Fodinibius sp. SL11 TaxID=3425690 RepID=UPI003F881F95
MMKRIFTVSLSVLMALLAFQACAQSDADSSRISATEFQEKVKETPGVVIDVRTQEEYDEGHLANVDHQFNLLNGDFEASLDSLDKGETYYLYCRTGNRSGQATELMKKNGFENVYNIGGFQELVDAGVESKK